MTIDTTQLKLELIAVGLPVAEVTPEPSFLFPDCTIVWGVEINKLQPLADCINMARLVYAAHDPTKVLPQTQLARDAYTGYLALPDWVKTGTADGAQSYISNQIWNDFTIEQANAYIDSTIGTVTGANLSQALASLNTQLGNVKTVFKAVASAVITLRDLFIITSKLLIYFRDFVIRVRTGG